MAKTLTEVKFRRLSKYFLGTKATVMRSRDAGYCILSEVRDYWRNKADEDAQKIRKWSACAPTPLTLIVID
jgi:hypothetical protein